MNYVLELDLFYTLHEALDCIDQCRVKCCIMCKMNIKIIGENGDDKRGN